MTIQEVNLSRRSVNFFDKTKDINMDLIKRVIEEANYAPSSNNLQPWRLILVRSDEKKQELYSYARKQQKVLDAPLTFIVVADLEGYDEHNVIWDYNKKVLGEDKVKESIQRMRKRYLDNPLKKSKFAHSNAGLFAMNLMLLCKGYGMDTHPIGGFDAQKVHQAFELQDYEEVTMLITVGYHDDSIPLITRKQRKKYKDLATEV